MSVVLGLIALIVSAAAMFVSITQADIARIKLRYDLFDRRFRVFEAYYDLVRAALGGPDDVLDSRMTAAVVARSQSHFLFRPDMPVFLEAFDKEILRIDAQRKLCRDASAWNTPQERAEAASKVGPDALKLMNSFPVMVDRFAPYLHLDDRPWWTRLRHPAKPTARP